VAVPAGALTEDAMFTVNTPTVDGSSPDALTNVMVEITAFGTDSDQEITHFDQPVIIGISYAGVELGELEPGLMIKYYDEELRDWRYMATYLDTENNIAYTRSNHLTVFGMDVPNWQAARLPGLDGAQTSLFTGAATYSMPFWTPPGPGGFQPSLALSYNSQVVDRATALTQASFVGMGWSLDSGAIERDFHGTMDYLGDDTFTINVNGLSERLLPGTDGYYHTASESFWRITWDTNANVWYAWDTSGTKYTFGETLDSRAHYWRYDINDYFGTCDEQEIVWRYSLNSVENAFGQELTYTYENATKIINDLCDENRQLTSDIASYPTTITYPNNRYRVEYVWATDRLDFWPNWVSNPEIQVFYQNRNLDKIRMMQDTQGDGIFEKILRIYEFTYEADTSANSIFPNMLWNLDAATGRTLTLASVQEWGLDGSSSLPATTFTYDDSQNDTHDDMHLLEIDNGYGGSVKFNYELWYDTDPTHISQGNTWTETISDYEHIGEAPAIGAACRSGGDLKKWVISTADVWCDAGGIRLQHLSGATRAYTFKVLSSGGVNARREWVRPGGVYYVSSLFKEFPIGQPMNAQLALFDTWPAEGDYFPTPPINLGDTAATGFISWATNRTHNLYAMARCEHCVVKNLNLYLVPSFWRVTSKTVKASDGDPEMAYQYTYSGATLNNAGNSASVCGAGQTNCFYDAYTEFRGHETVTETRPDGSTVETGFGQTDTDMGRVLYVTVRDRYGNLLSQTNYAYTSETIPVNTSLLPKNENGVPYNNLTINWTKQTSVETTTYEGAAGSDFLKTKVEYTYATAAQYGNLTHQIESAWNGSGYDYYRDTVTYYYPNSGTYRVGLPGAQNVYRCDAGGCVNNNAHLMSSQWYLYDNNTAYNQTPTNGVLRGTRTLLRFTDPINFTGPMYSDQAFTYDGWGNQTTVTVYPSETASNGFGTATDPRTTTTTYDNAYHTYATQVVNANNQSMTYDYNYSLGLPITEKITGLNDTTVSADYDGFGRLIKIVRPGDSSSSPTVQIAYFDTAEKFYVQATQKIDATTSYVSRKFYDGLGRQIQSQVVGAVLSTGTQTIVANTTYTYDQNDGQKITQYVPYAVSDCGGYCSPDTTPEATTETTSDALGRVVLVKHTDGTTDTYAYTIDLTSLPVPVFQTSHTDQKGNTSTSATNIWGQVVQTNDQDLTVAYEYDPLNRLTQATYANNDPTLITYDLAGRKLTLNDPDMGAWTYTYDALGNLKTQTDARSCTTTLEYDSLNRVTDKTYGGTGCPTTTAVAYTYDAGTYGLGQRTGMTDDSGSTIWVYDVRGRLITETKTISGTPYTTGWAYNSADLVTAITYPDNEVVQNTYLPQMALDQVTSSAGTYVNDTQYDAAGRIVLRTLGADSVDTTYTYYPWDQQGGRLHTLQSTGLQSLQNLTYTYDNVGNITSIVDTLAGGT